MRPVACAHERVESGGLFVREIYSPLLLITCLGATGELTKVASPSACWEVSPLAGGP